MRKSNPARHPVDPLDPPAIRGVDPKQLSRIRSKRPPLTALQKQLRAMMACRPGQALAATIGLVLFTLAVWAVLNLAGLGPDRTVAGEASNYGSDHAAATASAAGMISSTGSGSDSGAVTTASTLTGTAGATSEQSALATTISSSAATSATTIATATATTRTADLTTATAVVAASDEFPGINPKLSGRWTFPMKIEPYTPAQGAFGTNRTSARVHAGIDLYAPSGTEIYAMTDGRVRDITLFYNNLMAIEVENKDGTTIRYTELEPLVKAGDAVSQGQLIAKLRKNYSGTCMLHLEIYATVNAGALTQIDNQADYRYVAVGKKTFMRRSDLVNPSAVYSLARP